MLVSTLFSNFLFVNYKFSNFLIKNSLFSVYLVLTDIFKNFENFLIFFTLLIVLMFTVIGMFFDLKYKIIPNKLTFSLFVFGILINSIISIFFNNFLIITSSIIFSIVTFILCYILWKIGLWGGGDVKLISAIGATLPIHPFLIINNHAFNLFNNNFPIIAFYPFPLTIIANSLLISFPILLLFILFNYLYSIIRKIKINNNFYNINFYRNFLMKKLRIILNNFIDLIFKSFNFLFKQLIFIIISIFLFLSLSLVNLIKIDNLYFIIEFGIVFNLISSITSNIFLKFKIFIKKGTKKQIDVKFLKEGMIIDNLKINNKIIDMDDHLSASYNPDEFNKSTKYYNYINENDFDKSNSYKNKINNYKINKKNQFDILNFILFRFNLIERNFFYNVAIKKINENFFLTSKTTAGLSKGDIILIKKLFENKYISNNINIKIGLPFAPSILFGLIVSIFIGDLSFILYKLISIFF